MSDQLDPNDWRTVMVQFDEMFGAYRCPPGTRMRLRGVNLLTDEVLGLLAINGEVVEVSTGMFLGHRMFGVTWDRDNDALPDERSGSFESLDEVREHLMRADGIVSGDEVLP
jgi:hypothetical protein